MDLAKKNDVQVVEFGDEKYSIRFLTDDVIRQEIARKENDKEKDATLRWDAVCVIKNVEGWEGITSKGVPLPCTNDNKILVFTQFQNRVDFLFAKMKDEKLFFQKPLEEQLKN
jgi:hypothetical protein